MSHAGKVEQFVSFYDKKY